MGRRPRSAPRGQVHKIAERVGGQGGLEDVASSDAPATHPGSGGPRPQRWRSRKIPCDSVANGEPVIRITVQSGRPNTAPAVDVYDDDDGRLTLYQLVDHRAERRVVVQAAPESVTVQAILAALPERLHHNDFDRHEPADL